MSNGDAMTSFPIMMALAAGLAWLLTARMVGYAKALQLIDHPGHRRSHTQPTPRGGGLAFVVVQVGFMAWLSSQHGHWVGAMIGLALVATIGFADDHQPLSASRRLLVHVAAAVCLLVFAGGVNAPWWWFALMALWLVSMTNAWNFMDGINGIAAINAALAFVAYAGVAVSSGDMAVASMALVAAGAAMGFVPFNFPRSRIFMGDVGSGSLGFLIAALAGMLWDGNVQSGAILLFPVLGMTADAGLTLASRILRGRRWYAAHREHLYQWLVRSGYSHAQVVLGFVAFTMVVAFPHMWIAWSVPSWSGAALFSAMILATGLWIFGKRHCLDRVRSGRA